MFKFYLSLFILLAGLCYSQEIPKEELEKLPPEVREKLLEALKDAKKNAQEVNKLDEFTEEDLEKFGEKAKKELEEQKKKEAKQRKFIPKLPLNTAENPIDKTKVLEAIQLLGANHYKIRKQAKIDLILMGYQVIPFLKEALNTTNDPEVTESIKEIITKLSHRLHINQLNPQQKSVASLTFNNATTQGQKVKAEFYNAEGHFIIDIGLTRIAFPKEIKQLSGSARRTVNMKLNPSSGASGSSTSNDFKIYQYSHQNGVAFWNICEHNFTISSHTLKIGNSQLNLQTPVPQVLFFDKENKVFGILDLK